ncbi:hypothetical protein GH714_030485 [Hevea brasiliensis]|uniref:Cupin type-1 domain-containing protein n=1 Tax=Hevea brasiliensis TaxID=3981 RepID=A0A6A6KFG1_HEVBR|nr:hypothetical protein GH714_030485 [Hevea brasiliensis]
MDESLISEAFDIDSSIARKLCGENDNRGNIVKVREKLNLVTPISKSHGEREEKQKRENPRGGGGRGGLYDLEDSFCTLRMKENIDNPASADVYSPGVGRVSTVDSHNLAILKLLQLRANHVVLHKHKLRDKGSARVQVVNEKGRSVFDGNVTTGQVLLVPQDYVAATRANSDRFEHIVLNTNGNAKINPVVGRTRSSGPFRVMCSPTHSVFGEMMQVKGAIFAS